jgi:hypothetical protein
VSGRATLCRRLPPTPPHGHGVCERPGVRERPRQWLDTSYRATQAHHHTLSTVLLKPSGITKSSWDDRQVDRISISRPNVARSRQALRASRTVIGYDRVPTLEELPQSSTESRSESCDRFLWTHSSTIVSHTQPPGIAPKPLPQHLCHMTPVVPPPCVHALYPPTCAAASSCSASPPGSRGRATAYSSAHCSSASAGESRQATRESTMGATGWA